ncbi:hypothetical protein [Micromonospora sp. DPT]|uniref:hypothetical protein n=1 Tax=Micromonospora sp. DPT TaxID=3142975 RepID=UPI00320874F4
MIVMPVDDQARRLAAAAQHALDRGYQVTAVAPGMVALRTVLDGQAHFVIAAQASDLPEVQVADQPPPVMPRPRTSPDVVPPSRRPRPAHPRCVT